MTDEAKIAQQRTQIQATDTPARHGGSSAGHDAADVATPSALAREFERFLVERGVLRREGHGQDPAADGAQTVAGAASYGSAALMTTREATEAAAHPAPAQPAGVASYEWIMFSATLAPRQPTYEPPQLDEVLNDAVREGWEIFAILPDTGGTFPRARVVARRPR